jgi:hypothetical protein
MTGTQRDQRAQKGPPVTFRYARPNVSKLLRLRARTPADDAPPPQLQGVALMHPETPAARI